MKLNIHAMTSSSKINKGKESENDIIDNNFERIMKKHDYHMKQAFSVLNKLNKIKIWKYLLDEEKNIFKDDTKTVFIFKDETDSIDMIINKFTVSNDEFLYSIIKHLCHYLSETELKQIENAIKKIEAVDNNIISKNLVYSLLKIHSELHHSLDITKDYCSKILLEAYNEIDKLNKELTFEKSKMRRSYDQTYDALVDVIIRFIKINRHYPEMHEFESLFPGQTKHKIQTKLNNYNFKIVFLLSLRKLITWTYKGIKKDITTPGIKEINIRINDNTRAKILDYTNIYNKKATNWGLPEYL